MPAAATLAAFGRAEVAWRDVEHLEEHEEHGAVDAVRQGARAHTAEQSLGTTLHAAAHALLTGESCRRRRGAAAPVWHKSKVRHVTSARQHADRDETAAREHRAVARCTVSRLGTALASSKRWGSSAHIGDDVGSSAAHGGARSGRAHHAGLDDIQRRRGSRRKGAGHRPHAEVLLQGAHPRPITPTLHPGPHPDSGASPNAARFPWTLSSSPLRIRSTQAQCALYIIKRICLYSIGCCNSKRISMPHCTSMLENTRFCFNLQAMCAKVKRMLSTAAHGQAVPLLCTCYRH